MMTKKQWAAFLRNRGIERNAACTTEYEMAKDLIKQKAETAEEYETLTLWTCEYLGY